MEETKDERKERRAVEYLRSQLDWNQPETLLATYIQIIEQDVFHTQVGMEFLREIHDGLLESPAIDNARIPDYAKPKSQAPPAPSANAPSKAPQRGPKEAPVRQRVEASASVPSAPRSGQGTGEDARPVPILGFSLFLNVVLGVMVIVMFILTVTSDSPNIINYKNQLEDEYAAWDEELTMREQEVKKREAALEQGSVQPEQTPYSDAQPETESVQPADAGASEAAQPTGEGVTDGSQPTEPAVEETQPTGEGQQENGTL